MASLFRQCLDYVLMILSACGTLLYSRNPRRGLTFFASPKKVSKERRPERAQLRCALDCREPNDKTVCLPSSLGALGRDFKPLLDERGTASTVNLNVAIIPWVYAASFY
ncbi:hypothetical protein [uncultured Deefgea sp.]|uniref:hypothetical protein n=1 Tax=uncultured Deefgea sp. TaxID=1304914 RepID=UPI0025981E35|nr:hypothetical protein [uncultured Deefgea sp.]